ncbi:MAG: polysaccharide biosynthesis protein [Microbacteriaceae bacterium]
MLGTRGSVLTVFRAQSEAGGPITVTHPDVTRFFMTVEEAVRLTIYAGAIGQPGEVMVLDMGEPVRIAAIAERFANQHEPPLDIVFTGLRPGEKLHEDLIATDEVDVRPIHPLITHVPVPPLSIDDVRWVCGGELTCETLQRVVLHGIGADRQTAS